MGNIHSAGAYVVADARRAHQYYETSCVFGHFTGCRIAGSAYRNGGGLGRDIEKAVAMYVRGCEVGAVELCIEAADILLAGDGISQDKSRAAGLKSRAAGLFAQACDDDSVSACLSLAEMYLLGDGVTQNLSEAERYFDIACGEGGWSHLLGSGKAACADYRALASP